MDHGMKQHGDTFELPDGTTLKLCIEVDDIPAMEHINDADCWGKVAWPVKDRYAEHSRRPSDFDGAAILLRPNGWHMDSPVWWQPPGLDIIGEPWTREQLARERANITQLLADGFIQVGVKHLCEHGGVIDEAWCGGIDSFYPEVVDELIDELNLEVVACHEH